jgi:excisionase family DNA binding protein
MSTLNNEIKRQKIFLNIPSAAKMAGYSSRHFRRIIEENRIPVLQIGRKIFILTRDLEAWKLSENASAVAPAE